MENYGSFKNLLTVTHGKSIVKSIIKFIKEQLRTNELDMLEVAWAILWSITDDSEANCRVFVENNGALCFSKCHSSYPIDVSRKYDILI